MEDLYDIKLPAFEGPLDLLLHLIKENKIDIYDIPISFITGRYLEYINVMKVLDLEIAGEFLVMAASLIYIKSRMLLPVDEQAEETEAEDPRLELVQRLLEYQAFKDGAMVLREREEESLDFFCRQPVEDNEEEPVTNELYLFNVNVYDLLGAFKKMLDNAPPDVVTITRELLTVKDKMNLIVDMLENTESMRFEELFRDSLTRRQLIITFLALLELLRLGLARVYQEKEFGNIWIINPVIQENAASGQPYS
ncbi:MAG: segregation/condensation protein A [Nitrospirota bacterium]|nr:segregation/condensation protein A [Nitrospirota bacterium]